ncbi:MAG: DNA methyltransferase [SAR202 cluster bacterium]|nr:DNA methyltransferase [SAR202 cluster bacterium]
MPTSALQNLQVKPIQARAAKELLVREHYLHSMPGGTRLAFGVFRDSRMLGAIALGVGPTNAYRLVEGAGPRDCLTLSRLWLSDNLPPNSESRVIGVLFKALRRNTSLKFLISYADPAQGHVGTIYQATNWTYTGLSQATPLYDLGDGQARHSRSVSHTHGTHSLRHFANHGMDVKLVPQSQKHRYLYFLDTDWRDRLRAPVLPYPKELEEEHGDH